MYFGSVKFFKHLILTVVFAIIGILLFLAVFFGIKYSIASKQLSEVSGKLEAEKTTEDVLNIPDGTSLEQLYLIMTAKGFTTDEILEFLKENDSNATENFIDKYAVVSACADVNSQPDTTNSYSKLYPDLYVDAPAEFELKDNTIYLTFDDGPSENTLDILRILDKYDIKATFFMCGSETEHGKEIMKKVADAGHTIGVHSYSHDYEVIYKDVESYLDDFNYTSQLIYDATGVKPNIFRFPGGSLNNYNRLTIAQIEAEMIRRGYVFYDWNVSAQDADNNATWTSIYNNVLDEVGKNSSNRAIILMHDSNGREITVKTLEDIIVELKARGYEFAPLDNTVMPITFDVY